jgi:hypothetical protein
MGMLLGNTVYVFSIILAVFLAGLAIGSAAGSVLLHRLRPRLALGWSQILLTLGIAWTAYMIADSLPYWPIDPMQSRGPWDMFQLDLLRCLWAILPPALLWGAAGLRGRGHAWRRFRTNRRRSLRGQYTRRDRGRSRRQPGAGPLDRHAEFAARPADSLRPQRFVRTDPAAF